MYIKKKKRKFDKKKGFTVTSKNLNICNCCLHLQKKNSDAVSVSQKSVS